MMSGWKWLIILVLVCCASCGPRREYVYLNEAPWKPPATTDPSATPPAPGPSQMPAPPSGDRCERVCYHVGTLGGALVNDVWFQDCVASCHKHASDGQLSCYERVERLEDLEACTVK